MLTPSDIAAAAWAIESGKPAGRGVGGGLYNGMGLLPGAIGYRGAGSARPCPRRRHQAGARRPARPAQQSHRPGCLALERSRLEAEARSAEELRERNQLRAGLLATIGQDVEPRLSAITNGVNDLRRSGSSDKALVSTVGSEVEKLRRYLSNLLDLGPESDQRPVAAGDVTIDLFRRAVSKGGDEVHLTPKEYSVLAELAKYPGRVLSHAHLLRTAWGPAQENQIDYLRVAVRGLRQKLEDEPSEPKLILNEPGVGYRLIA